MEQTLAKSTAQILKSSEVLNALSGTLSALSDIIPQSVNDAREFLQHHDFPTTRDEDWKYTRTTKLSQTKWVPAIDKANNTGSSILPDQESYTFRFHNGVYCAASSCSESSPTFIYGTLQQSTSETIEAVALTEKKIVIKQNFFTAINKAHCTDGLTIVVKKNCKVEKPIQIIFEQSGEETITNVRVDIVMEEGSEATVITSTLSPDTGLQWSNICFNAYLKPNSALIVNKIQQTGNEHYNFSQENIGQEKDSRFDIVTMTIDGGWVRNNLNIQLLGENAESNLSGFYLPRGKQLIDNHTMVDHRVPNCNSNELYKGVLYDQSTGVFNGKVYVQKDAQKTNAYQNNANILASEFAQMNTKPELEIYADDVKCSHGTTTGQMDDQALFYLQARGIGEENARRLLTTAFIGDVLNKIHHKPVKDYVITELTKRNLLTEELR